MSKLTKEEIQTDTTAFETKSRIIEDILNRQLALRRVKIPGVQKITITLTVENGRNSIAGPVKGFSPVVNITKACDFKSFNFSSEHNQNELVLSMIEDSLREAANRFAWNFEPLNEVLSKVREFDFKHCYQEWKLKLSRDKSYRAGIEVEMTPQAALISAVFYSKDDALVRKVSLINVRPNRYFVSPLMGVGKWISNTEFELIDKRREIHFRASPIRDKAELYFTPNNRDTNKVIDDLLILSASTSDAQAISILRERLGDQT